MLTLKCDNRSLTKSSKFSYLANNYVSGVYDLTIVNSNGFSSGDYVVIGEFGSETTEICQLDSVDTANHLISSVSPLKFSHSQDTKISILPYNQVRFYHTTSTTFSITDPVTGYIDIQPDDFYTMTSVSTTPIAGVTDYGWFVFYNATTLITSAHSNAIPYTGFEEGSVKKILDAFYSLLNNKELRLVTNEDAFRWLNEAYSIARNELNLVNSEYTVPAEYSFTTVSGTQEYSLPSDFSDAISVTDTDGNFVDYVDLEDVRKGNNTSFSTRTRYYLRGKYIGFVPLPTSTENYYVFYKSRSTVLTSYYDNIDLPDDNYYPLVDHMLYRASIKVGRPNPEAYEAEFDKGIQRMKVVSIKQDANKDSWGIDLTSNI